MKKQWQLLLVAMLTGGMLQVSCMMPEEGTIIYDQDYPELPTDNVGGSGSGSSGGDGSGSGSGERNPESNVGFTVTETDGVTSVTESGNTDTISVVLDEQPTADVTISLDTYPEYQITTSFSSLTFTPSNWDSAQVVTISAIEDGNLDGDVTTTLRAQVSGSADPSYASGISPQNVSVTAHDSGTIILPPPPATGPGITVTQSGGNTAVEESGVTDTITVVLNEQPAGDVTVAIASPDGEINADPAEVNFLASNWNQPQYVTISAVEDGVADNDQDTTFTVAVSNSSDSNYTGLGTVRVPVKVIDSGNVSGIVITSSGGNNQVKESGDGDSFEVFLSMQPNADVMITLSDNDTSEISYSPSTLSFTPDNWDTTQTVNLSAEEDNIKDGNQTTLLTLTSSSDDSIINGVSTSTEVVTADSATEPGVTITDAPFSLIESGASKTLSFELDTPPAASTVVTITLSDNDSSEIHYDPATLTFTSSNWNTAQTVEVSAVEDGIQDGDQQVSLNISVSSNPAGSYGSTTDTSLTITTQDSGNTPPDSPTGLVATPTLPSGYVDLSWTEPTNPAAESYTIYWSDDPNTPIDPTKPSTFTDSITITALATTEAITGLDPANDYDFTIIATNSLGDSTPATEVNATPIPEAPTGLTASTGAASGQIDLEWNPSLGADSYTIYYSNDGGNTFTPISPNVTGTSYPHTGLNDGTEYTYYVVANNVGGISESSDTISATPGVEPPDPPTDLKATAGSGEVMLNWTAIDGADDYTIYVSTGGSGYTAISPNVTGTSFTHSVLTNGKTYYYYVVANNAGEPSADSNVVSATPTDPGTGWTAPVVTLTPGEQKIAVAWAAVDGAVSYNLNWSNTAGYSAQIENVAGQQVSSGSTEFSFIHAPLEAAVNHTYTIEAVDADDNAIVSAPETASALPLSCPIKDTTLNKPQNLLAYYSFDGNLEDSVGDFDLTATGDSIVYGDGCANGTSGYFDGDGGYAYNLNFNDNNVSEVADGSWTIAFWVNADEDMNKFASMVSSTSVPEESWGKGFQIDVTDNLRPRLFACKKAVDCADEANTENYDNTMTAPREKALQLSEWTHIAVTMDNQTAVMYLDGEEVISQSGLVTEFNRLKVGLNRWEQQPWKGYLDELMIFGDALTADEVMTVYNNVLPAKPENLLVVNQTYSQLQISWDPLEGIDEYRVYYSETDIVNENSPYFTVIGTTSLLFTGTSGEQIYTFAVAGINVLGIGELSNPQSGTVREQDCGLIVNCYFAELPTTPIKTSKNGTVLFYNSSGYQGWNNTKRSDKTTGIRIEIWTTNHASGRKSANSPSNTPIVEINSNKEGSLYQDITVEPGETLDWNFVYRSRDPRNNATVALELGAPGAEAEVGQYTTKDWQTFSGQYTVPSGITTLRVRFSGVEDSYDSGTYGHLLDSVIFKNREVAYVADVDTDHPSLPNQKAVAVEFSPDGSKLYLIVGRAHILYNTHRIIQYNLSAPWDVRTAVKGSTMALKNSSERLEDSLWTNDLVWNPDGTKLIVLNDSSASDESRIRVYSVPTPYDLGSVINATSPVPEAVFTVEVGSAANVVVDHPLTFEFNSDGTKMIVAGFDSYNSSTQETYQRIQEFDLAGSYDFSTITKKFSMTHETFEYGGKDAIDEVIWKSDGTKFITLNLSGDIHMYSVTAPFDSSNSIITKDRLVMSLSEVPVDIKYIQTTKFEGLHFNPTQNRLYYIQNTDSQVSIGSIPFSW